MDLENIQAYCLSLENTTEDIKWQSVLTFSVYNKIFVLIGLDVSPINISFKTSSENYAILIEKVGFKPAPYLARYHWVQIENIDIISDPLLKSYLYNSYCLIKSKISKKSQTT